MSSVSEPVAWWLTGWVRTSQVSLGLAVKKTLNYSPAPVLRTSTLQCESRRELLAGTHKAIRSSNRLPFARVDVRVGSPKKLANIIRGADFLGERGQEVEP